MIIFFIIYYNIVAVVVLLVLRAPRRSAADARTGNRALSREADHGREEYHVVAGAAAVARIWVKSLYDA